MMIDHVVIKLTYAKIYEDGDVDPETKTVDIDAFEVGEDSENIEDDEEVVVQGIYASEDFWEESNVESMMITEVEVLNPETLERINHHRAIVPYKQENCGFTVTVALPFHDPENNILYV